MTRSTSIAGSSTAILKAANKGNAWFLQRCKNRCGYSALENRKEYHVSIECIYERRLLCVLVPASSVSICQAEHVEHR
jgi:hypothetical protein